MELRRLKWAFLAALAVLLLILEWTRSQLEPYLVSWQGRLLFAGVVAMCVIFLVGAAFTVMSRMQERLALRNRELLALDRAARDIYGELSLETILELGAATRGDGADRRSTRGTRIARPHHARRQADPD